MQVVVRPPRADSTFRATHATANHPAAVHRHNAHMPRAATLRLLLISLTAAGLAKKAPTATPPTTVTDGTGTGYLVYNLADKRCENFNTCGSDGTASTGTSKVNSDLLELFRKGRNYLLVLDCAAATAWVVVAFGAGPWPA